MPETLEERMTKVEHELERLTARVSPDAPQPGWISKITGSFKDEPAFDEILRLGKEARDADRPKVDA